MGGSATISKYRILGKLGKGGMADVFLAVAEGPAGFTKLQVIKTIHAHLSDNPEFVTMFLEEARLAALLNHPNVVQTNEVGFENGKAFMVMEYLEGQPLHGVLRTCKSGGQEFELDLHLRAIAEVLAGLHYAHELTDLNGNHMGFVHRDVTPHNVFITYDGGVKLLDFGIAKASESDAQTRDGMIKGKVRYLAPEQVLQPSIDRRADIFQAGVMFFEAVTGQYYWDRALPDVGVLGRLFNGELTNLDDIEPSIEPDLAAICRKALAFRPEDRYPTANDFRVDIEEVLGRRNSKSNARDVGARVATIFSAKHADMKKKIEGQLRLGNQNPFLHFSGSFMTLTGATSTHGAGSNSSLRIVSQPSAVTPTGSLLVNVAKDGEPPPPKRRTMIVAGVALVAVVGLGIALFQASPEGPPAAGASALPIASAQPAEPVSVEVPAPSSAPVGASVRLRLSFQPRTAAAFIDSTRIAANPFVGDFPKDDSPHRIRVEATGYETRQFDIILDKDQVLEVSLIRIPQQLVRPKAVVEVPPPPPRETSKKPPSVAPALREDR